MKSSKREWSFEDIAINITINSYELKKLQEEMKVELVQKVQVNDTVVF